MRCANCNTLLQDKARFCSTCGTPVVTSGVNHNTEDSSISSETSKDDSSSSQTELEARQSALTSSVSLAPGQQLPQAPAEISNLPVEDSAAPSGPVHNTTPPEQHPQTSVEASDLSTEDNDVSAEPTRIITTPEQLPHTPAKASDGQPQNSTVPSEQTQIIVAPHIPTRPQPFKQPVDAVSTYEIPKAQTYVNSQQAEQHKAIVPTQQVPQYNSGERVINNARAPQETPPHLPFLSPNTPPPSLPYFRLDTSSKVRYMLPAVVNPQTHTVPRRRRGGSGCLLTLLVLVLIIGGAWFFVLQPFLHNYAENQLNEALSAAVDQIPAGASALPTSSLKISETVLNNLIVLNTSPSSPIQSPTTHITPTNIQIDFQLYGLPCAITAVPQVQNNQLVVTDVTTSGIIGLVLSPNDIATIINQHLTAAQNRLQRPVKSVQLKEHEVDLTLG